MNDVMIDLETLGTLPGSVILSIGAVMFDPLDPRGTIGQTFYRVVSQASCLAAGLTTSASTLEWWSMQNAEARKVLAQSQSDEAWELTDALMALSDFIPKNARVWSNGANFDQPLLDVAYNKVDIKLPWEYWNSRCYRTIKSLVPNAKDLAPETVVAHNALEDAKWQTIHLQRMMNVLARGKP